MSGYGYPSAPPAEGGGSYPPYPGTNDAPPPYPGVGGSPYPPAASAPYPPGTYFILQFQVPRKNWRPPFLLAPAPQLQILLTLRYAFNT